MFLLALALSLHAQYIHCHEQLAPLAAYVAWAVAPNATTGFYPSQSACEAAANPVVAHPVPITKAQVLTIQSGTQLSRQPTPEPLAKATDGTEPLWVEAPVVQKIPHCQPNEKLMMFEEAFCPNCAVFTTGDATTIIAGSLIGDSGHPALWVPAGAHPSDTLKLVGPVYRCFKDATAGVNIPKIATDAYLSSGTAWSPRSIPLTLSVSTPRLDGGHVFPQHPVEGQKYASYVWRQGIWCLGHAPSLGEPLLRNRLQEYRSRVQHRH